jgi:hypothetical protein
MVESRRHSLSFELILILGLGFARPAISCTCTDREPLFEDQVVAAFDEATDVFFGEVETVRTTVETNTWPGCR